MPKPCIEVAHLHPRLAGRRRRPQEDAETALEDLRSYLPGCLQLLFPGADHLPLASQSFVLSCAPFCFTFLSPPRHTLRVLPSLRGGLQTGASPCPGASAGVHAHVTVKRIESRMNIIFYFEYMKWN